MNVIMWAVQAALVLVFVPAAAVRALRYEFAKTRMSWVGAVPRPLLVFISGAEILGAIGLVLPGVSRTAPGLTVAAAAGLAAIQFLAIAFHLLRRERRNAIANAGLFALLLGVAAGRALVVPL